MGKVAANFLGMPSKKKSPYGGTLSQLGGECLDLAIALKNQISHQNRLTKHLRQYFLLEPQD